jgi:hypothetical protein
LFRLWFVHDQNIFVHFVLEEFVNQLNNKLKFMTLHYLDSTNWWHNINSSNNNCL